MIQGSEPVGRAPTPGRLFAAFLHVGAVAFGAAASEVMLEQLVERRRWLTAREFRNRIAIAGLLPGPFHVHLAIALGYRLLGYRGAVIAAAGFALPGFLLLVALLAGVREPVITDFVDAHPGLLTGLLCGAAGLVLNTAYKLARRSLAGWLDWVVAGGLVIVLSLTQVPIAPVLLAVGLAGVARSAWRRRVTG